MLAPFVFMENAMKISFYYVDEKYVQYLKDTEISERGFTCIPNMEYHNHDKFVYGVVLSVVLIQVIVMGHGTDHKKETLSGLFKNG